MESKIPKSMQKPLKLEEYNGKGEHGKHVQLVNEWLNYYSADNASKLKLLGSTLVAPDILWFNGLLDGCIESWTIFYNRLTTRFTA